MKLETIVNGRAGRLTIEGKHFRYEREGADPIEGDFDAAALESGAFTVLLAGRSYEAIPSEGAVRVNGRKLEVEVLDPRAMRGRKGSGAGAGRANVISPMPGKVVRILVTAGDTVEAGQGLVVVEAMKMQNEMKSPKAGRVAEVKAKADATVAAGEVLVVIE